jgi:hypothetical protein
MAASAATRAASGPRRDRSPPGDVVPASGLAVPRFPVPQLCPRMPDASRRRMPVRCHAFREALSWFGAAVSCWSDAGRVG